MSRGFGSTVGAGTTDIVGSLYKTTTTNSRSYSAWVWVNGAGGSGGGVVFAKTNGANAGSEFLKIGGSINGQLHYARYNTGGSIVNKSAFGPIPLPAKWMHILLTNDGGSNTTAYLNGISQTVTAGGFNGTAANSTDSFFLGNRTDGLRNWDGYIAHFALWDNIILGAAEALALSAGANPLSISPGLLQTYLPLDGINNPEFDPVLGTSVSITGTTLGKQDVWVQGVPRRLFDYQSTAPVVAGQILPFPWMLTTGNMRDMTGGMRG